MNSASDTTTQRVSSLLGRQLPSPILWTNDQQHVISGSATERMLVDAGPGTGKTAVACARVAWLIDADGVNPSEIWLVSFTRTAVHELRSRIGAFLRDPAEAAGIRIATIDSHAWKIQSGFNREANLTGSYEDNIRNVSKLIQNHEGVFQYLHNLRHLFVDEAQDIVGPRAELVLELIHALTPDCGVTILSDEAQAIYGFSKDDSHDDIKGTLPECIRKYADDFTEHELTEIHRTENPTLRALFLRGRALLRDKKIKPFRKLRRVRELVSQFNHGDAGDISDLGERSVEDKSDTFLLFRSRGEALTASGYLGVRTHRLRMSGLPPMIHAWIGLIFWDWTKPDINKSEFDDRWAVRMNGWIDLFPEVVWGCLVGLVGLSTTRISVEELVKRITSGAPPADLCLPDFGYGGPLVGTIHGAKGREADQVRLYLPGQESVDADQFEEEARVLFVGASRARKKLFVGRGATQAFSRSLDTSGRSFTPYPYPPSLGHMQARAAVEIGRLGDIHAEGLVGRSFFPSTDDVLSAQALISTYGRSMVEAEAQTAGPDLHWAYAVKFNDDPGQSIAFLSNRVNEDMFGIGRKVNEFVQTSCTNPPNRIPYMRSFGARTLAVAADDPAREVLHSPWRDSGLMLAPLLLGYGIVYFRQ